MDRGMLLARWLLPTDGLHRCRGCQRSPACTGQECGPPLPLWPPVRSCCFLIWMLACSHRRPKASSPLFPTFPLITISGSSVSPPSIGSLWLLYWAFNSLLFHPIFRPVPRQPYHPLALHSLLITFFHYKC